MEPVLSLSAIQTLDFRHYFFETIKDEIVKNPRPVLTRSPAVCGTVK